MKILKDGEIFLDVDVADSLFKKLKGLMFKNIDGDSGLFLSFDREKRPGIWMPFVPQDLGLIFLDADKKVVDKKLGKRMTLNPGSWQIYKPSEPCKYVLECDPERLDVISMGEVFEW
ncbi:MAG: DUF192 domain-containing protein [Candidatus Aenigmatarchaeota archaeon]